MGPNLDQSKPSKGLVVTRLTNGKGAMPSFRDRYSGNRYLTNAEMQALAEYVSSAARN